MFCHSLECVLSLCRVCSLRDRCSPCAPLPSASVPTTLKVCVCVCACVRACVCVYARIPIRRHLPSPLGRCYFFFEKNTKKSEGLRASPYACTQTQTHTDDSSVFLWHTHPYSRTHTPALILTHLHACTYTCTHTLTHIHLHTHTYTCTHTHTHIHTLTYTTSRPQRHPPLPHRHTHTYTGCLPRDGGKPPIPPLNYLARVIDLSLPPNSPRIPGNIFTIIIIIIYFF